MMFQRAVAKPFWLRLAIDGPAGSGKTYSALQVATYFAGKYGQTPAFIDTERGSASKYAGNFAFDVVDMAPPYHPDRFVKGVLAAIEAGYKVVVIDSLSHAWNGVGGLLELVDNFAKQYRSNSYAAWKDATPIQTRLIDTLTSAECHIIACLRAKMEYAQEADERGKMKLQKVGLAPVQREGMEYEFDVVGDMNVAHSLSVSKTRCVELTDSTWHKPGADFAGVLWKWTQAGQKAEPAPIKQTPEPERPMPGLIPAPVAAEKYNGPLATMVVPDDESESQADYREMIEPTHNPAQAKAAAATNGKGAPSARIGSDIVKTWPMMCQELVGQTFYYRNPLGQPDMFRILRAAKAEGFDEVNAANADAVYQAVKARGLKHEQEEREKQAKKEAVHA